MKVDTKAIRARAAAASPTDQWGQKWDGTLGRGEIRVGPQNGPATARFVFQAFGFRNAGTQHPDFILAINARADVPALCDRVEELERVLRAVLDDFPDARRMPESVEAARVALGGGE